MKNKWHAEGLRMQTDLSLMNMSLTVTVTHSHTHSTSGRRSTWLTGCCMIDVLLLVEAVWHCHCYELHTHTLGYAASRFSKTPTRVRVGLYNGMSSEILRGCSMSTRVDLPWKWTTENNTQFDRKPIRPVRNDGGLADRCLWFWYNSGCIILQVLEVPKLIIRKTPKEGVAVVQSRAYNITNVSTRETVLQRSSSWSW